MTHSCFHKASHLTIKCSGKPKEIVRLQFFFYRPFFGEEHGILTYFGHLLNVRIIIFREELFNYSFSFPINQNPLGVG